MGGVWGGAAGVGGGGGGGVAIPEFPVRWRWRRCMARCFGELRGSGSIVISVSAYVTMWSVAVVFDTGVCWLVVVAVVLVVLVVLVALALALALVLVLWWMRSRCMEIAVCK